MGTGDVLLLLRSDTGASPDARPTMGYSTYPTSAAQQMLNRFSRHREAMTMQCLQLWRTATRFEAAIPIIVTASSTLLIWDARVKHSTWSKQGGACHESLAVIHANPPP